MTSLSISRLMASVSIGTTMVAAPAALAQSQGTVGALTDTITVTATKSVNPEDVQDVPLAVTAFNDQSLDALNVQDLEDLTFSAPNVVLEDIGTARGQANFSIRGLGVNSSIGSIDPTVGVFVDGVYLGITSGVVFDLFDLDSIEILRGPQGILFGRNTTGGAVLINTGNPTDEFEARVRYAVETPVDDGRGGLNSYYMGTVSGPIVKGKLNGKFGIYYNDDDGYFQNGEAPAFSQVAGFPASEVPNPNAGSNLGEAQTQIIRGALEWFANDRLTFLAKAEIFDNEGDGPVAQNRGLFERDTFDVAIDEIGLIDVEAQTFSLRTDWELNFGTVTNITGYRNFEQKTLGDIDSTPAFVFHSDTQTEQEQISNELRYAGTWGKFDVKAGLFYFHQTVTVNENRDLPPLSPVTFTGGGTQIQDVYGVFSQVDYNLTDSLILTGGLRFGYEEKDVEIAYVVPRVPACDIFQGTCPTNDVNSTGFEDDDAWQNLSPKVGFQWIPTDDAQVYGHWTRGFRSGGYNFRITDVPTFLNQVAAQSEIATDEEQVDSFEIGTKIQALEGRAQVNVAAFFTQIEDMQREVNLADPGAGVSQLITNTADADILGAEFEGQYLLTENLLLTGNFGWIDAEYTDVRFDINSDGVVDAADENLEIPRVPEFTYGASLIHDLSLGNFGTVSSRVSFQHRDEQAYTDNNFGFIQEADILDANITWITPKEGLTISVYADNLLDEVQAGGDTQISLGVGPNSNFVNEPFGNQPQFGTLSPLRKGRLLGFEVTYDF